MGSFSTGEIGDDSFSFGTSQIAGGVSNPMIFRGDIWRVSVLWQILKLGNNIIDDGLIYIYRSDLFKLCMKDRFCMILAGLMCC